jgi:hypothetical protein
MGKKSTAVSEPRMKPMLYLYSDEMKIPNSVKGRLGKSVTLSVKAKVVSQRLTKDVGRKQRETYDLEIQRIKSSGGRRGKKT